MRCTTLVLLAILLALPFSFSFAKEWPVVGANPTTTAAWVTLNKMDLDPSVVSFTQNNFPESTWVVKGMVFNELSEGIGVIKRNVRVTFDSSKALVWHTGNVDVYYVLYCNNVGWKSACNAGTITPPAADPEIIGATTDTTATEANADSSYWPAWAKAAFKTGLGTAIGLALLSLLIALIWLLRRLWSRRHTATEPPYTPTTYTPPAPPTGPTPPAPPTPSPQVSDIDKLNELAEKYRQQRESLKETKGQIFSQISQMREESAQRTETLSKIEEMLKS